MSTILGICVIVLVAGIMIYMQVTQKPENTPKPEENNLHLKSMEAVSSVMSLYTSLSSGGYLSDPDQHEKYKEAMKLLVDTAAYFDPKNKDRR